MACLVSPFLPSMAYHLAPIYTGTVLDLLFLEARYDGCSQLYSFTSALPTMTTHSRKSFPTVFIQKKTLVSEAPSSFLRKCFWTLTPLPTTPLNYTVQSAELCRYSLIANSLRLVCIDDAHALFQNPELEIIQHSSPSTIFLHHCNQLACPPVIQHPVVDTDFSGSSVSKLIITDVRSNCSCPECE